MLSPANLKPKPICPGCQVVVNLCCLVTGRLYICLVYAVLQVMFPDKSCTFKASFTIAIFINVRVMLNGKLKSGFMENFEYFDVESLDRLCQLFFSFKMWHSISNLILAGHSKGFCTTKECHRGESGQGCAHF